MRISRVLWAIGVVASMAAADAWAQAPLASFRDCETCPEMVALPPGDFMMGATAADAAAPFAEFNIPSEQPRHAVSIGYGFAIGKREVTIGEFRAFVEATGVDAAGDCWIRKPDHGPQQGQFIGEPHPDKNDGSFGPNLVMIAGGSFAQPGFAATEDHPAACLTRELAEAYLDWLSGLSGRRYRLPSEAEWEYATRAGSATPFFWGADPAAACRYANFADAGSVYQAFVAGPCAEAISPLWAAPAGSFEPNAWGLHDTVGNVQEMLLDCWSESYADAPADGSPAIDGDCENYVARGGDYELPVSSMRAAERLFYGFQNGEWDRFNLLGFRAAVSLDAAAWDAE